MQYLPDFPFRIAILENELIHLKETNEKALEISRMENEALNQKFAFSYFRNFLFLHF